MPHTLLIRTFAMVAVLLPLHSVAAKDIALSPEQIEHLQIKLAKVQMATDEPVALVPATVIPALNAHIAATAPFAGTVAQVHVVPGQPILKGDPIATIASRELLDARGQLAQSEAELQAALAVARRKRALSDKNIASPSIADEAEAQVAKIEAVVAHHRTAIRIGGISLKDGGHYTINAPLSGNVAETLVMTGDVIAAMAAAATIDATEELWLDAQVPVAIVERVGPGDSVQLLDGQKGKVISVGHHIDKLTRSAKLLASLPANSGLLPGQMVTLNIVRSTATGGLKVPSSAVTSIDGKHSVFIRTQDGFALKPITLRGRSSDQATFDGDLAPGDIVAASGLPQLESILGGS